MMKIFLFTICLVVNFSFSAFSANGTFSASFSSIVPEKTASKWKKRLVKRFMERQMHRLTVEADKNLRLDIASRDSNCLVIVFENGQTRRVQNVRIAGFLLYAQPCGVYSTEPDEYKIADIDRVETENKQIIFNKKPRDYNVAHSEWERVKQDTQCQNIVLANGTVVKAAHVKIFRAEVVFSPCDDPQSNEISISRWYVHAVGSRKMNALRDQAAIRYNERDARPLNKMAVWALLLSAVGTNLGLFGLLPLLLGMVFGIISLHQIRRSRNQYRGRGLAITSIVISASLLFLYVILILSLGF